MNTKIAPDHLCRTAVVYVRQSTLAQVTAILKASAGNMTWRELRRRRASRR